MAKYIVVHSVRVCTEFTPETYGRLTVIGPAFCIPEGNKGRQGLRQVCACSCGSAIVAVAGNLRTGNTQSCGCLKIEVLRQRAVTHGQTASPEYESWRGMKERCNNPNHKAYAGYGGRGIGYCDRWEKFEDFLVDVGLRPSPEHTLDRFPDQNGNYELSNCRWATRQEQANNRRGNHMITIGDKTDTLPNWCRYYRRPYRTVRQRINPLGWEPLKALTTPIRHKKC